MEEISNIEDDTIKRRKRPHDSISRKRKINKNKRMRGEEYMGFSTNSFKKIRQDVRRDPRKMGPSCASVYCKKQKNRNCEKFDEVTRSQIFGSFWKSSWEEKRLLLQVLARSTSIKRSRVINSKKIQSVKYCLYLKGELLQVCRTMFLSTLGLKRDMVERCIKKATNAIFGFSSSGSNDIKIARSSAWSIRQDNRRKHLIGYFDNLEKMDSHYCRKDTKKLYIKSDFLSKAQLYQNYVEKCKEDSCAALSYFTFATVFENHHLSLFSPRKDQCDTCVSYSVQQISQEEYDQHIANEKRAQAEKIFDKKAAKNSGRHVFSGDVQAVKLSPSINSSAIYYKQRLQSHNYTIYNLLTRQCTAYWWNESEGDLSASSFVSCLIHHLEKHCLGDTLPITLYSDGCGYQNRNQFLANALSNFAIKNKKIIEQKFLEKGHTQMEVDSVHAKIEKKLKKESIYIPDDFVRVTKAARQTVKINGVTEPKPIEVEYLSFSFFKNYAEESCLRFNSIRPGNKAFDPTVTQLRSIIYLPSGGIKYKIDFNDDYKDLPRVIKPFDGYLVPKPLHSCRIKITEGKWNHLQSLKSVIPTKYHHFYDNLPFVKTKPNERTEEDKKPTHVANKLLKATTKPGKIQKVSKVKPIKSTELKKNLKLSKNLPNKTTELNKIIKLKNFKSNEIKKPNTISKPSKNIPNKITKLNKNTKSNTPNKKNQKTPKNVDGSRRPNKAAKLDKYQKSSKNNNKHTELSN